MPKMWFQLAEQGAGAKRLILSYWMYKIFGEKSLRVIAFFVVLIVFLTAKERRKASAKFFKAINKPVLISSFKQFLNYGNALVDKFISFTGDFDTSRFIIDNEDAFNGAFFITTHIGNVEILRSLVNREKRVNIFLQSNACEIFNQFLKTFEVKINADTFPVEEINAETSILISDRLKNGEIVFMAGDRISASNINKVYPADFIGKQINLPLGTLKFALMMDCPVYFIVCVKEGKNYKVYTRRFQSNSNKKSEKLEDLKKEYSKFLEEFTLKYPYQFYNFYEMMN